MSGPATAPARLFLDESTSVLWEAKAVELAEMFDVPTPTFAVENTKMNDSDQKELLRLRRFLGKVKTLVDYLIKVSHSFLPGCEPHPVVQEATDRLAARLHEWCLDASGQEPMPDFGNPALKRRLHALEERVAALEHSATVEAPPP